MSWEYKVCPRCGNPLILINGVWVCRVCGYVYKPRDKSKEVKPLQ